jgi:hypothetical protein
MLYNLGARECQHLFARSASTDIGACVARSHRRRPGRQWATLRDDVGNRPGRYERSRRRRDVLGASKSIGLSDSQDIGRRGLNCLNHFGAIISMT